MEESYITLRGAGESRYEEKKSVFIGYARPLSAEKEATAFIAEIKQKHPDARHHVYAYLLRDNHLMRYSDDREPQGTAGLPVLDVLRKSSCVDAGIVVVRYFGGTLLGTGGLVRAYTAAAQEAIRAAGILICRQMTTFSAEVSYADYQKLLPVLTMQGAEVENTDFGACVKVSFSLESAKTDGLATAVFDATGGRAILVETGARFAGK